MAPKRDLAIQKLACKHSRVGGRFAKLPPCAACNGKLVLEHTECRFMSTHIQGHLLPGVAECVHPTDWRAREGETGPIVFTTGTRLQKYKGTTLNRIPDERLQHQIKVRFSVSYGP